MKTNANVLRAEGWTATPSGNGASGSLPKFAQENLWAKLKRILPHREDIVMADGRQIKGGIVIHPIIATAILAAIVGSATLIYRNVSAELAWQHDQLITLSVQKAEGEKRAAHDAEELSKRLQNMDAVGIVNGRDIAALKEAQKLAAKEN